MLRRFRQAALQLLYKDFAGLYDCVSAAVSLGQWRAWQRAGISYLPPPASGLVLELAHGTGDLQLDLQAMGYHSCALDLSPAMGRLARRKLQAAGIAPRLARADAQALPYAIASIAAIICTFPTGFIFQPAAVDEIARVLVPGGCAVFVLSGYLAGGGAMRGGLRALFHLIGQSDSRQPAHAWERLFPCTALDLSLHQLELPGSRVDIALLRKLDAG